MGRVNRKTTPRVKRGRVQKKNNWELTPNYYSHIQPIPVIDRRRPGEGYRHLLLQRDIELFISILPDWDELAKGLDAIVLAEGEWNTNGYHTTGVVHICAWDTELWTETVTSHFEDHRDISERIGLQYELKDGYVLCKWTAAQAKAYQLIHILLHELGHHHDRITTKSQLEASRGEPYAEAYALKYLDLIWEHYIDVFGLP
jgi:hypothetical protein